jgi:tetratricopeptide (TPR) repeat protein
MKKLSGWMTGLAALVLAATSAVQAQGTGAALHGHITNPAGASIAKGDVKLTTDKTSAAKDRTYKFTFPINANGDYKGADVAPGDYLAVVMVDTKTVDFQNVSVKAGDDKTLDFDMTRAEYLKAMTPEDRAALEEYKKKNAAVSADNAKIANINKTLVQAREDEKNGKADDAVKALQGLVAIKADEAILWASLGEAQLASGDTAVKAARAAKTSTTDPAILQSFTDAATSYQKAIDLNAASKKPSPENLSAYYLNLGQALSKSGKLPEAGGAYEAAAKTSPTMAGSAYYNESVVFYQAGKMPEAGTAADKAIAADPKRADAYYIKAQALIPGATADAKTGKFVLPPGCLEAYQEYLELAPDGPHAKEVQELLTNLGQPVKNSFKAPGKK